MNECKFTECDRKAIKRGWCNSHYEQWRRGTEVRPLHQGPQLEEKRCPACERTKAAAEFYQRKQSIYLSPYCRVCTKKKAMESKKRKLEDESM